MEIERKFLVVGDAYKSAQPVYIAQGYLNSDKHRTVRVRVQGDTAQLTVKTLTVGITRQEYEYPIPVSDARELLAICEQPVIEKNRYSLPVDNVVWEIDEFLGENAGLVVAEAELTDASQELRLPSWIGREVSDDPRYFNSNLVKNPFKRWEK